MQPRPFYFGNQQVPPGAYPPVQVGMMQTMHNQPYPYGPPPHMMGMPQIPYNNPQFSRPGMPNGVPMMMNPHPPMPLAPLTSVVIGRFFKYFISF